jgi:anti-sigma regulatory factor (Ser/Thr protein kinase)
MDTPAGGRQRRSDSTLRASILGSVTVSGEPEQVSLVRKFIARTLAVAGLPGIDSEAATLLTSELVTNALLHTDSGLPGGSVTVVVRGLQDGILVEVVDDGSAGTPVVKDDALAGEGQGLYLVQQMAAQWGYLRDNAGTTVWFYLPGAAPPAGGPSPPPGTRRGGDQHWATGRARTAASTPSQINARSSSLVT